MPQLQLLQWTTLVSRALFPGFARKSALGTRLTMDNRETTTTGKKENQYHYSEFYYWEKGKTFHWVVPISV